MDLQGPKARVLIVGGGVGALEAALALGELAAGRVEVELCSPRSELHYRPLAVGEPFGAASLLRYDLEQLTERCGASLHLDSIASVDGDRRRATTHDGEELSYDYLVLATGARGIWSVPGAVTFWGVADEGGVFEVIAKLRAGKLPSLAFTLPGRSSWTLPVYELALLADSALENAGIDGVRLTIATPEDEPLQVFGKGVAQQMKEMLAQRGIALAAGVHPVKAEGGRLQVSPQGDIEATAVIALPRLEGRRVEGIPHDADGFVPVDEHGRVHDMDRVFAVGDVTTFPVKQGGIATQQADAAAAAIAAELGGDAEPRPFDPVLRAVLWTGGEPRYLYGRLSGGHGETSIFSGTPPWEAAEAKILGRYLTPFLAQASPLATE